jgi:hypothetical protein
MTGFESKRQAAQAKLDDDDAQVYIAEYEAALLVSYQSGFADGKKAAQPEQEPVAWRTFDGEGGYDYRTYDDNENYHDEWGKRNPNHKGWVEPVYTTPPAAQRPWVGLTDEDRRKFAAAQYGWEDLLIAAEAKLKERNRGATTHCQCAACKNGNIHDSDCSVHNGDALPVGPCDCSLATPPVQPAEPAQKFYQPAANEAVEILKSLGYVYEPTYTGLAWVAKKSAQLEQEPSQWRDMVVVSLVREGINKHKARELADHFATTPAVQRKPLTANEILNLMPSSIPADHDGALMDFARSIEAKLKERNT